MTFEECRPGMRVRHRRASSRVHGVVTNVWPPGRGGYVDVRWKHDDGSFGASYNYQPSELEKL